jgi:hypothetical protein
MDEPLQHIDVDYYRAALLLVVRADIERLRQEHSSDVQTRRTIAPGASEATESALSAALI